MITLHVFVPVHPDPVHPLNTEPRVGVAVSVIGVPLSKTAMQSPPQLIPAGSLVTVPEPLPAKIIVSVREGPANLAVIVSA